MTATFPPILDADFTGLAPMTLAEVAAYGDPADVLGAGLKGDGCAVLDLGGSIAVYPADPHAFTIALAVAAAERTRPGFPFAQPVCADRSRQVIASSLSAGRGQTTRSLEVAR